MTLATVLVADWGGAAQQVLDSLPPEVVGRALEGSSYVDRVNAVLHDIDTPYIVLCDGSGAFPERAWVDEIVEHLPPHLKVGGVTAVTMPIAEQETYGRLVPSCVAVRTQWLQQVGLCGELKAMGWEQVLDNSTFLVVTSRFGMRRVLSDARQQALGVAYYDSISDNNIVERLCEL